MKNTFGNNVSITLFGESHGEEIGAVLDGIPSGVKIDCDFISRMLHLRSAYGDISTKRTEPDEFKIVSGVFGGFTTGTPICIIIPNKSANSDAYAETYKIPRPSHADFTAHIKYNGYEDYRGSGHFSGRITAALVAAGAIALTVLQDKGIYIGTHISRCAKVCDRAFCDYSDDIKALQNKQFPVLSDSAEKEIYSKILEAANDGDSVGGVLETAVIGIPAGVGEPWFDSVESMISHAVFSIPAVKGIEFGIGFSFADITGSEANDAFKLMNGKIVTETNNNGGVNGGITNGMPVIFRTVIKPTPSIFKEQNTVDLQKAENTKIKISGRHDPAIIHRARVVVDCVTALTLLDLLKTRYGENLDFGER